MDDLDSVFKGDNTFTAADTGGGLMASLGKTTMIRLYGFSSGGMVGAIAMLVGFSLVGFTLDGFNIKTPF